MTLTNTSYGTLDSIGNYREDVHSWYDLLTAWSSAK